MRVRCWCGALLPSPRAFPPFPFGPGLIPRPMRRPPTKEQKDVRSGVEKPRQSLGRQSRGVGEGHHRLPVLGRRGRVPAAPSRRACATARPRRGTSPRAAGSTRGCPQLDLLVPRLLLVPLQLCEHVCWRGWPWLLLCCCAGGVQGEPSPRHIGRSPAAPHAHFRPRGPHEHVAAPLPVAVDGCGCGLRPCIFVVNLRCRTRGLDGDRDAARPL